MQEMHVYEYATVRFCPRVERAEFINEVKVLAFSPETDLVELRNNLMSFENICKGSQTGGPIGRQDLPSRFRWLTAKRSTILQASEVHPGYTDDPQKTLQSLLKTMVL
jgi:hypothetical protein